MFKKLLFRLLLPLLLMAVLGYVWLYFGSRASNPHNYTSIGEIPVPCGYERVDGSDAAYSAFLRSLPLAKKGTKVMLYTGDTANYQFLGYAVLELPLLSNAEQCADACIRLRAEYLWRSKQYSAIHFNFTNGFRADYSKWAEGYRISVKGNKVEWYKAGEPDYGLLDLRMCTHLSGKSIFTPSMSFTSCSLYISFTFTRMASTSVSGVRSIRFFAIW